MSPAARSPKGRSVAPPRRARRRERGIALVLVLWLTVLLTVIAGTFAFDMRNEALSARTFVSLAQARAIADGAIERFAFELVRPRVNLGEAWKSDGKVHPWTDGDAQIVAWAVDEAARIDLNTAPDALLKSLLINVGQADEATATSIVDAIADWRDPDDLRRPNGAEAEDYRAANAKYVPANGPFDSVADLMRVLGMTPQIYARIAPALTVYSRLPGINPQTASRDVLRAIPNITPDQVDSYLAARQAALDGGLPAPAFPYGQGMVVGAAAVWRIHVEARLPDGVTFVREAVIRPTIDARHPLVVLAWTEGSSAPPGPPADPAAAAQAPEKTSIDARRS